MRRFTMRTTCLLAVIVSSCVVAWAADPFVGSWKLDLEKSSTRKGKATEEREEAFVAIPNGYRMTDRIGSGPGGQREVLFDGTEHKAPDLRLVVNTGATSVIARRVSSNIIEQAYKRDGRTVAVERMEVSGDGNLMTQTADGSYVDGSKLHNVFVYKKQ